MYVRLHYNNVPSFVPGTDPRGAVERGGGAACPRRGPRDVQCGRASRQLAVGGDRGAEDAAGGGRAGAQDGRGRVLRGRRARLRAQPDQLESQLGEEEARDRHPGHAGGC